jgi:hypothetical protein
MTTFGWVLAACRPKESAALDPGEDIAVGAAVLPVAAAVGLAAVVAVVVAVAAAAAAAAAAVVQLVAARVGMALQRLLRRMELVSM